MTFESGGASGGLRAASSLGGFFEVQVGLAGGGWEPLGGLLDPEGAALRARIDATRAVMAATSQVDADAIDHKAAASVVQLGLVSRLMAPALAAATLTGWVPALDLDRIWWRPQISNPVPLAISEVEGGFGSGVAELAAAFEALVLNSAVTRLTDAVLGLGTPPISPQVLWGNVASAVAGAAAMLGRARPDLAERGGLLARAVIGSPRLREMGEFGAQGFRRHNCCLFYRVPGAGLCGDCVLLDS